jgi:hypothetical protein
MLIRIQASSFNRLGVLLTGDTGANHHLFAPPGPTPTPQIATNLARPQVNRMGGGIPRISLSLGVGQHVLQSRNPFIKIAQMKTFSAERQDVLAYQVGPCPITTVALVFFFTHKLNPFRRFSAERGVAFAHWTTNHDGSGQACLAGGNRSAQGAVAFDGGQGRAIGDGHGLSTFLVDSS